jgi:hypothetical protein
MEATLAVPGADDVYARFRSLDGSHPFRRAVPRGFVDYRARRVRGAKVAYFNFALAREIGLIPADHPDRLTHGLDEAVRETFALTIVNEHDVRRGIEIPARGLLPGPFMATRYLQLQHPGRRGATSGDGRSVWIGSVAGRGTTWDFSACGTGVTRLCPATAWTGRFYKTGSRRACYGCGTATVFEGLSAAVMSECFHGNGIRTERVLAVLALPGGFGITVRAYPSLLRPAHFFVWLKQGDLASLRGVAELFYERQVGNGAFPALRGRARWKHLAEWVARSFARAAASFESEYVFCWLDWDGDNVLMDGGVLDYGSVRQFGLYHREYRYDDGPRWSTTIPEQRRKARYVVQTFAQIRDALETGRRRPLSAFRRDPVVRRFDGEFEVERLRLLLRNIGFSSSVVASLLGARRPLVERFRREHRYFERASSRRRLVVTDGITRNAVYSTRDLLRELPLRYLEEDRALTPREFLRIAASTYASRRHRSSTPARARRARAFQRAYLELIRAAARIAGTTRRRVLEEVASRSAIINRFARITGDASIDVAARLSRTRRRLDAGQIYAVIRALVGDHLSVPEARGARPAPVPSGAAARRAVEALRGAIAGNRHGL